MTTFNFQELPLPPLLALVLVIGFGKNYCRRWRSSRCWSYL